MILLLLLGKPKRHKMVFYKFGFLFIGVPKTGTTSIQRSLHNRPDLYHDHYTYFEEYKRHDVELLDSFYQFSIVRNPYDRFVSMAYQWARDAKKHEKDINKICEIGSKSNEDTQIKKWNEIKDEYYKEDNKIYFISELMIFCLDLINIVREEISDYDILLKHIYS